MGPVHAQALIMRARRAKPGVTVDYRHRQIVNKTPGRALPANVEVYVCPTCAEYIVQPPHRMEAGHVHLTVTGEVCDNFTEFQKAEQPDAVIAAYLVGGPEAMRGMEEGSGDQVPGFDPDQGPENETAGGVTTG